jgi:Rhodopirellula transposase DDE domain
MRTVVILLLDPAYEGETRGDPESPLRWTCKSTRAIAEMLHRAEHRTLTTKTVRETEAEAVCRVPLMRRLWRFHSVFTVNV